MKAFFKEKSNIIVFKTLVLSTLGVYAILNGFRNTGIALISSSIYLVFVVTFIKMSLHKEDSNWFIHSKKILFALLYATSIIGLFETPSNNMGIRFILAEVFVFLHVYAYFEFRARNNLDESESIIKKWGPLRFCFRMFFIGVTVLLILTVLYQYEPLDAIFDPYYFVLLIAFLIELFISHLNTSIKLKNEQTQAELLHLRSQLNPHFFFNTLNNLYALTIKNSKLAPEVILKLSEMMRYTIYEGEKRNVTIKDEITYLENYIELHKIRYKKSVLIEFNHAFDKSLTIAPLLFINLLENAFKHGVDSLREDAFIKMNLSNKGNTIYFSIENNFKEKKKNQKTGIGQTNLKRRLSLLYPKKHTLEFTQQKNIYKVILKISI